MLVMTATNAVSERSFSALKPTFVQQEQTRMNNLMVQFINFHNSDTDNLDFWKAANEFIERREC